MTVSFKAPIWYWRGPAPFYFATVPDDACDELKDISTRVTYGWGMIPVTARIGKTSWETSLWPKEGKYIVPIKLKVRTAEGLDQDDIAEIALTVEKRDGRLVSGSMAE